MKPLLALLLLLPVTLHAQTPPPLPVTGTSGVSFTDSDNDALNTDGTPVVAYYELRIVPSLTTCGAAIPVVNLGKPAPAADGVMTAKPLPAFGTLTANCAYAAFLAAVGPGGQGVSPLSDPFVRRVLLLPAAPSRPTVLP